MEVIRSNSVNIHRVESPMIGVSGKRPRENEDYSTTMGPNLKYHAWIDAPWSGDNIDMHHDLWIWAPA